MYQHSGVGQRIRCFLHFELGSADFHSGAFSPGQNLGRFVDASYQFVYPCAHGAGRDEALVSGRVTSDADRLLARADHFIARLGDEVVAVALNTFSELTLVKRRFVRTGLKQFSLSPMTRPADVRDRSDTWRCCAMIAMTIVAGRCGQILLLIESFGVNTLLIFLVLIARNSEPTHVIRAGVTLGARLGNVRRIDRRERILGT